VKIKERKGVLCGEKLSHKCKILMEGEIKHNMQQKRFSGKNMCEIKLDDPRLFELK